MRVESPSSSSAPERRLGRERKGGSLAMGVRVPSFDQAVKAALLLFTAFEQG
jgi:hypothetical protein